MKFQKFSESEIGIILSTTVIVAVFTFFQTDIKGLSRLFTVAFSTILAATVVTGLILLFKRLN